MPEGKGYGPQNTFSLGKEIHVIGGHCYCYPGSIEALGASSGADTIGMSFTTGNYYVVGEISWTSASTSTSVDESVDMFMNGARIFRAIASTDAIATTQSPIDILIPAYTSFEFKFGFSSATLEMSPVLTGRIYGKIKE